MTELAEIKAGTKLHDEIVRNLILRERFSWAQMADARSQWEKDDQQFQSYIPESDADAVRRVNRQRGKPQYTTIVVPYSYAQLLAAHTYLASVFLSRAPVWQFQGRHGESEENVLAVEALMDYQVFVGGQMAALYVWLLDALRYGIGIVGTYWDREENVVTTIEKRPILDVFGNPILGRFENVSTSRIVPGYEGNRLFSIRPVDYIPDPRVELTDPQKGEFCGRRTDFFMHHLLQGQAQGRYMNIDKVKEVMKNGGTKRWESQGGPTIPDPSGTGQVLGGVSGFELQVNLVPKEWKLGSRTRPEKWVFTVIKPTAESTEGILIEARPLGQMHNRFNYEVIEGEIEGYGLTKRSLLTIARPMNDIMTWLFNSHFYSVRKSLNGEWVYDPSRVVKADLLSEDPGKRIRLRPEAYGTDVRQAITALQGGSDVTRSHVQDTQLVGELLQRTTGVTDNLMGVVNPGGRKTATEIRSASGASVNRLRTIAEYISAIGFTPLAQQMLQATQQFYDAEKVFRVAGRGAVVNPVQMLQVTPESIAGFYDFVPVDGTLPVDRFAMVTMWANLIGQVQRFPQIAQAYDWGKIFSFVAKLGGLKNIDQMRLDVQVMDDERVAAGADQGQLIGTGAGGGGPSRAPARGGDSSPVIPLPRRASGLETPA